jgi:altronate hydrolase
MVLGADGARKGRVLRLHPEDTVGVALEALEVGETLGVGGLVARDPVPSGHKVALVRLKRGDVVTKLGAIIGCATTEIPAGAHVHRHNVDAVTRTSGALPRKMPLAGSLPNDRPGFQGYHRADGRVGTRNVLVVLPTVNCSATVARRIATAFRARLGDSRHLGIDGVVALCHAQGCSVRADGPGMAMVRRVLAGYARHANVGGVLVVGLGCEDNQPDHFLRESSLQPSPQLHVVMIQEAGGTLPAIETGVEALGAMLPQASASRREAPLSALILGLQCGGSDGFSAISANPALGAAVDRLIACGGTAILSETPEIVGAEALLLERATDPKTADKLRRLLARWQEAAKADGGTLDANPSPGNHAGGITTILEKSLGAVAKSGTSPLTGVFEYAEPIHRRGLVFMDSPGYDPVSATGQIASGANLICFTTGRGSCFGTAPVPSLKVSSTSELACRMAGDIDIDCGTIIAGTETIEEAGERILSSVVATASGQKTASETLGYGEDEFVPWTPGLIY